MFKQGETVIYPMYGVTKINKVYDENVNGKKIQYYEVAFMNNLTVCIPTENADKLGLRYPLSDEQVHLIMKKLSKKYVPAEDFEMTVEEMNALLFTGALDDAVELIRILKYIRKEKLALSKSLSTSEKDILLKAMELVNSEVSLVLGAEALDTLRVI